MSNSRVEWKGLTELHAALRQLPQELTAEATDIIQNTGSRAQAEIVQAYPEGPTGNLRRGVTKVYDTSRAGTRAIVRSRARHAWLFEHGSRTRRTGNGANRGRMPQAQESQRMIPIVIRLRRQMVQQLKDLVRRAGFQVE